VKPLTCARCGQEVRHGTRNGHSVMWLHREDADHHAVLGRPYSREDVAAWEAELDRPRTRVVVRRKKINATKDLAAHHAEWCEIEEYTTRAVDLEKYRKSEKFREAEERDVDELEEEGALEPIEVYSTPCPTKGVLTVETPSGPRPVAVPGGARTVILAAEQAGWEILKFTYARGPYLGAKGGSLGVADTHRLLLRGPSVDGEPRLAVAWWRNAKSDAVWRIENNTMTPIGAKALISWMKESPRAPD
jgi:hypothetical protein